MHEKPNEEVEIRLSEETPWELHVGGSSNQVGAGVGIVLSSLEWVEVEYFTRLDFSSSNNVAEYAALVLGLRIAELLKVKKLKVYSDSQLIVNQANEEYITKDKYMETYQRLSRHLF